MKKILVSLLIIIECCSLFLMYKSCQNKTSILNNVVIDKNKEEKKVFAIMLEQTKGRSDYLESENDTWPTNGYKYNQEKSACIDNNGQVLIDALTYDDTNDLAIIDTNDSGFCYLYFDIE